MKVCESLKKLSLENMKREYSTYDLSEFGGCKQLTHLSLKGSGTDWKPVEGVLHILQYLPKLTYLDLTNASLWENVASGYSEDYGGFIDQKV